MILLKNKKSYRVVDYECLRELYNILYVKPKIIKSNHIADYIRTVVESARHFMKRDILLQNYYNAFKNKRKT